MTVPRLKQLSVYCKSTIGGMSIKQLTVILAGGLAMTGLILSANSKGADAISQQTPNAVQSAMMLAISSPIAGILPKAVT